MRRIFTIVAILLALNFTPVIRASQGRENEPARKAPPAPPAEDRVDINRATLEQLLKVPGMTRSWAERILRFRPYRTKQDLLDLGVLPGGVYYRIKDFVIARRETQR